MFYHLLRTIFIRHVVEDSNVSSQGNYEKQHQGNIWIHENQYKSNITNVKIYALIYTIIKNDKPDVATGNFRIAFNEVWYDQVCLMHACNNTGTKFKSLKYVYSLINVISNESFLYRTFT